MGPFEKGDGVENRGAVERLLGGDVEQAINHRFTRNTYQQREAELGKLLHVTQ